MIDEQTKIELFNTTYIPNMVIIAKGFAHDANELSAFDNSLFNAQISNLNLVKVSSIMPPNAPVFKLKQGIHIDSFLPPSACIPSVIAKYYSKNNSNKCISAGIGIGIPDKKEYCGMIFEAAGPFSEQECEQRLSNMIEKSFSIRRIKLDKIIYNIIEQNFSMATNVLSIALLLSVRNIDHLKEYLAS